MKGRYFFLPFENCQFVVSKQRGTQVNTVFVENYFFNLRVIIKSVTDGCIVLIKETLNLVFELSLAKV